MRAVLLHGYGATGDDLRDVLGMLGMEGETPSGPLDLGGGARAWFELTMDGGKLGWDVRDVMAAAAPLVERVEGVLLGGFSQGASMVHALLALGARPAGAVLASGFSTGLELKNLPPRLPVLVTHGRQDPVVPFRAGEAMAAELRAAGAAVETAFDDSGHTISLPHLAAFAAWTERLSERRLPAGP